MRPIPFLVAAIVLTVVAAFCLAAVPARGADGCCSKACTCGCDGERPCQKCTVAALRWERHDDDQFDLLDRAGRQVGSYRPSDDTYRPRAGAGWGDRCEPPVDVPECCRRTTNYGVDAVASDAPRGWSISGKPVDAGEAGRALAGGPAIPDDAGRPYVLWVGDDATGERVKADAGDKARVQAVPPGHWMTLDRDGKPIYSPGLWFVRADGTAVGHEPAYRGAEQLTEGLRRCAPDWKPDAVPDLAPPAPPVLPFLPSLPSFVAPAAVLVPGGLLTGGVLTLLGLFARRLLARKAA